eukprot:TRINITY_DN5980_c0_g2_i2.p1 TRINITY_DN5980_c0_g2~~TRINITY_DN5980_c0_g2_i2.p1  ORF type:complete len:62 (-),score=4.04 TRINITY_DN5980_c0_g2_i2:27-212(-)
MLHLVFNMSSLWALNFLELQFKTLRYCKYILVLVVLSNFAEVVIKHILIKKFNQERFWPLV